METMMQAWRIPVIASAITAVVCLSGPAAAQLDEATDQVQGTTSDGAASQDRIDNISASTEELVRNYRAVLRRLSDLREYNGQLEGLIASQEEEKESIREQIERVRTIERDVVPLMLDMIDTIENFVEADTPFLIEERTDRVERLRNVMDRADVNISEKFRVVLEAYQIENDYGRTIEAYNGFLGEGDDAREVDFLMIGRAAFYYQTLDRAETAVWNASLNGGEGGWQPLDDSYADEIRVAMDMAREFIPPELLILPMFGPTEAETSSADQSN